MTLARTCLYAVLWTGLAAATVQARPAVRPAYGPSPDGRLEVRVECDGPIGFCDVRLEREGDLVRRGRPDPDTGVLTFDRLPPGRYDVHAVARSFVPRGREPRTHAARVPVWMRNGTGAASGELRTPRRNARPEKVRLVVRWSRPLARYLIADGSRDLW